MASSRGRSSAGGRPQRAREGLGGKSAWISAHKSSGTILGVGTCLFYRTLPVCRHAFSLSLIKLTSYDVGYVLASGGGLIQALGGWLLSTSIQISARHRQEGAR